MSPQKNIAEQAPAVQGQEQQKVKEVKVEIPKKLLPYFDRAAQEVTQKDIQDFEQYLKMRQEANMYYDAYQAKLRGYNKRVWQKKEKNLQAFYDQLSPGVKEVLELNKIDLKEKAKDLADADLKRAQKLVKDKTVDQQLQELVQTLQPYRYYIKEAAELLLLEEQKKEEEKLLAQKKEAKKADQLEMKKLKKLVKQAPTEQEKLLMENIFDYLGGGYSLAEAQKKAQQAMGMSKKEFNKLLAETKKEEAFYTELAKITGKHRKKWEKEQAKEAKKEEQAELKELKKLISKSPTADQLLFTENMYYFVTAGFSVPEAQIKAQQAMGMSKEEFNKLLAEAKKEEAFYTELAKITGKHRKKWEKEQAREVSQEQKELDQFEKTEAERMAQKSAFEALKTRDQKHLRRVLQSTVEEFDLSNKQADKLIDIVGKILSEQNIVPTRASAKQLKEAIEIGIADGRLISVFDTSIKKIQTEQKKSRRKIEKIKLKVNKKTLELSLHPDYVKDWPTNYIVEYLKRNYYIDATKGIASDGEAQVIEELLQTYPQFEMLYEEYKKREADLLEKRLEDEGAQKKGNWLARVFRK